MLRSGTNRQLADTQMTCEQRQSRDEHRSAYLMVIALAVKIVFMTAIAAVFIFDLHGQWVMNMLLVLGVLLVVVAYSAMIAWAPAGKRWLTVGIIAAVLVLVSLLTIATSWLFGV